MDTQIDIFNIMYPAFKITKPIRLIEMFGGYGSQHLALKYLGVEVEHWKLVEWAVKSIQAYKDLHYTDINIDYSKGLTKEELVDNLFNKGISSNYNEPMTYEQIKRLKEEQLRNIYNNIKITKNLVNIQNVKGKDLEIVETDKYEYIMTYSFPCQDLSLAGKRKGMSDTSTRSGMLWEVERILSECKKIGQLPQVLLMENVPQVHSTNNLQDFNKWQLRLEELGYKNYWQDLIATDYGIPQTRNRTFMVSILGDYSYTFPQPIPLKLKLKDMLEDSVDEKYYLSNKMIDYLECKSGNAGNYDRSSAYRPLNEDSDYAWTINTRAGSRPTDNFIKVHEATKQGYSIAREGDGVYIQNIKGKRGLVQKGKIQTLKTSCDDVGVVVNSNIKNINDEKGTFSTLGTNCGSSTSAGGGVVKQGLRIRKLTPRECGRLQGVKDSDITKLLSNQSDSSAYHCFGDAITVPVLCAIFGELLDIDYKKLIERWNYNE